jgi:hypothetical protein
VAATDLDGLASVPDRMVLYGPLEPSRTGPLTGQVRDGT